MTTDSLIRSLIVACLALTAAPSGVAAAPADATPPAAQALIDRALPGAEASQLPRRGRDLFEQVLASDLFVSGQVGPFDVHVLVGDNLRSEREAKRVLGQAVETLEPSAALIDRLWPEGGEGLISGTRFPVVLADSDADDEGFAELLSLLDHCERKGYSGWHPVNQVDTPANLAGEVVRTWEVQLFNLAHETIDARRKDWLEHGIGYYSLAFVANRALRRGAWGMVPPWLAHGLIDELDIAAHGQAWVGQESWVRQTPGWFRPGWSGFVPVGHKPPPPVIGPPANLAVTVRNTGDPWLGFDASEGRHWDTLVSDRKTEAPFSFVAAAEAESFLPRDRAAARCLMHLMVTLAEPGESLFTALLDTEVKTPRDGMPDSEPLPVLFAHALGGVPEVQRLDELDSRALLEELQRPDLIALLETHGAEDALALADHREQSRWLMRRPYDGNTRNELFQAFLEIEWVQQLAMWKALAPRLDAGLVTALAETKRYPRRERDLPELVEAFRAGVSADPLAADDEGSSRKTSSKRSRR
jgi:hypothetical protein